MAIPHIVALYQWLLSKESRGFPVLSDDNFTTEVMEEAKTQSLLNKEIFIKRIARLRGMKQTPAPEDLESAWFDNSEDYAGLSDFIGFIHDQITEEQQHPLQLTLNYLLIHPETATHPLEAFNTLFTAWMAANPIAAVTWYEDEATQEKLLSISQETRLAIGKVLGEHYLQESRELFKSIEHPIGLIPLFAEYYDNPDRTAAFILFLLEQGTTPKEKSEIAGKIIQSGLLHEFFLTHARFMESRDNPVTQLYGLLSTFIEAKYLVEKAQTTSVMTQAERLSNKRCFESYALDGAEKHAQLEVIETHPVAFDAAPPPDHFKPFYHLFGQRFLLNLLSYYRIGHHASVKGMLEHQFNHLADDGLSARELVQLLKGLARENQEPLLRAMAELLQETTINALIESDSFAVFHLIPFKPALLDKLDATQVQRYIASIRPDDNPFDQLILLRTMLAQLESRSNASEVTALVFDKMIEVLMSSPNLSGTRLIETLRSVAAGVPRCKELLQQQATRLATLLNQSIEATMATSEGLTPDTFITLADVWRSLSQKLNTLKEISPYLASDFPRDKYAFYVSVVKAAVRVHEKAQSELKATSPDYQVIPFNLQATLSHFFPVVEEQEQLQNYPEDSVSEHERTLIEVIAAIDNEALWAQAILLLEAPPIHRLDWTERDYGGNTVAELVAKQGNNRFIQYLLEENKLNSAAVSHLLKKTIAASQWETVKQLIHLTGDNKPDIESVSDALVAATKAGQLERLLRVNDAPTPGFFLTQPNKIRLPIEPTSLTALTTAHGEEETVKQLIKLSPELLKSLVTRTNVTDYSGRTFTNISPFQYSLWAMDWHMWDMMLDSLQEAFNEGYTEADAIRCEMLRQYKEVVDTRGVDYTLNGEAIQGERHFDLKPLIDALDTYVKNFDSWDWPHREKHWCHAVGMLQRLVPAHIAQHYCEDKSFDGNKPFHGANFSRSLQFNNFLSGGIESWFPLSQDNRLGFDFAIYNYAGEAGGGCVCGRPGAAAASNSAALSALCKLGTNNIESLSERLATPLQKRDLDVSHRMS